MPESFEHLVKTYLLANAGGGSIVGDLMTDELGIDFQWAMAVQSGRQNEFFQQLKTAQQEFGKKEPVKKKTLEATWWMFDREPGMDDIMEQAGDCAECLQQMFDKLKIYPFQDTQGNNRLFLARFEFPKYQEDFTFGDAVHKNDPNVTVDPMMFFDFLGGFPLDCVEMMVVVTQYSTDKKDVHVQEGSGVVPPVPDDFFTWPKDDRILFNYTAIAGQNCEWMATTLEGEPAPQKLHWWVRAFLGDRKDTKTKLTFPMPGEFVALAVRIMPDKPWGSQKSSPFMYAGNWFDTVYYTAGVITEIIDPTDTTPYPTYKVRWRVQKAHGIYTFAPSDFAEYKVGDRVTILKDVATDKKSQLWKDDDMKQLGQMCQLVPITFYNDLASKKQ